MNKKWRCETCRKWFKNCEPAMVLRGCVAYLGKPAKKSEIVYARYVYCAECA